MELHFTFSLPHNKWLIYAFDKNTSYQLTVTQKPINRGELIEPCAELSKEQFGAFTQALKTAMIESNLLTETGGLEGELKATHKHLDDMRKLVFKQVGTE